MPKHLEIIILIAIILCLPKSAIGAEKSLWFSQGYGIASTNAYKQPFIDRFESKWWQIDYLMYRGQFNYGLAVSHIPYRLKQVGIEGTHDFLSLVWGFSSKPKSKVGWHARVHFSINGRTTVHQISDFKVPEDVPDSCRANNFGGTNCFIKPEPVPTYCQKIDFGTALNLYQSDSQRLAATLNWSIGSCNSRAKTEDGRGLELFTDFNPRLNQPILGIRYDFK